MVLVSVCNATMAELLVRMLLIGDVPVMRGRRGHPDFHRDDRAASCLWARQPRMPNPSCRHFGPAAVAIVLTSAGLAASALKLRAPAQRSDRIRLPTSMFQPSISTKKSTLTGR